MTGLMAMPAAPLEADGEVVDAGNWFPPYPLADLRDNVRLGDGVVTTERLKAAIVGALLHLRRELGTWQAARVADGATELAAVLDEDIGGENLAEQIWRRAVRYLAAAELANNHRDVTATDKGLDRALEKDESADHYRAQAWAAIADLLSLGTSATSRPRNTVELI